LINQQFLGDFGLESVVFGPIPTLASKPKCFCAKIFTQDGAMMGTKTGTKFFTDAKSCQRTPTRP
jgi:hypothetical protein